MEFALDNRERKLMPYFTSNVLIEPLEVGDFVIRNKGAIVLVLERKTLADLHSSICDGRYAEQKQRLKSLNTKVIYLLEGTIVYDDSDEKNIVVVSTAINLALRDGFHVVNTANLDRSAGFIKCLISRYLKTPEKYLNDSNAMNGNGEYIPNVKSRKKDNNNADNVFITQLCAFPGISLKKAWSIVETLDIHNMRALCTILTSPKVLESVDGIGKKLSITIFDHLKT